MGLIPGLGRSPGEGTGYAFIVCLLLNVSFMGVGLKTLSHSLLIPESIEYIEYVLDPQKQMLDTLSCRLSHFVSDSL